MLSAAAKPNAELSRKIPAGLLPSPSFLIGPDKFTGAFNPLPQPSPLRPTTIGIRPPVSFHGEPTSARSNRRSPPGTASQPSVTTTNNCLAEANGAAFAGAAVVP